jgi:Flp pilus assembly protein TadG
MLRENNDKGFVAILLAVGLIAVLLAIAGMAVDIGRAYKVRGELQNSADAASLSGAMKLYSSSLSPNWARAQSKATADIQLNKSEGVSIVGGQVQYGYYNNGWAAGSPVATGTPPVPTSPGFSAAVSVAVSRSVPTLFAKVVEWTTFTPGASAVAMSGFPETSPPGEAFPFTICSSVTDEYFAQTPLPDPPTPITDTSVYHLKNGTDITPGQWTSLTSDKQPSANTLSSYIEYLINSDGKKASPAPAVQVGDPLGIFIDPGTMGSVYHSTQDLIDSGKNIVLLPVVNCSSAPAPNTDAIVTGFVAMKLDSTVDPISGKKNVSMTGHFVDFFKSSPGSRPGGPPSNTITPPILAK